MKICLIHNLYPPFARGGAEKVVKNLAQAFQRRGDEVIVITTKPVGQKPAAIFEYPVYYLPSFYFHLSGWPYWARFFWHLADMFDLGGFFSAARILRRFQPEIVITNNLAGLGLLIPAAIRSLPASHIHILHDIQLLHPSGLLFWSQEKRLNTCGAKSYQWLARQLMASPDLVISPSKWLWRQHQQKSFFPNSRRLILPNPAPSRQFSQPKLWPPNNIISPPKRLWRWLYVGQIESHKGLAILLKAFSQLASEVREQSELVIVGQGQELAKMKRLAKSYGQRGKHIYFLGAKDSQAVSQLMLASDYLLLPSLCYENSPTVIYEALACGLPVIAFDLGGIGELLKACPDCLLLPPASWRDLSAAMERVFYARRQRAGLRQNQPANKTQKLDFLSPEEYIEKILNFLTSGSKDQ